MSKNSKGDFEELGFASIEEWEDFLDRLGNLTLLDKALNRAIKDKTFRLKISDGYENSDFLLTLGIAKTLPGSNAKANAVNKVKTFEGDSFGKEEIVERQKNLALLAGRAFGWENPAP